MTARMQQRRGTAAQWTSANPILADGEIGLEKDTGSLKIGDGATPWTALPYGILDKATADGRYAVKASPIFTGGIGLGSAPLARVPVNLQSTLSAGLPGTSDKVGQELATVVTGDLSSDTGSNPTFVFGLNAFGVTGTAANDGKGATLSHLIEWDVQSPSGTIARVTGLQAEASFYGPTAGATVSQMESLRVAAPKRKDGATAGTATAAYGLFIENFDGTGVSATTAFALFVEGGVSRFGGRVDVTNIYGYNGIAYISGGFTPGQSSSINLLNLANGGRIEYRVGWADGAHEFQDSNGATRFKIEGYGNLTFTNTPSVPTSGRNLYVENGALKYRGSSGTVTVLGPA